MVSAEAMRDSAMEELEGIVKAFQTIEAETSSNANLKNEQWSCCHELGCLRQLTGTMLLKQGHDVSAKDRWLKPAIADFRKAVAAVKPLESSNEIEPALKSAFSGQSVAYAIGDQDALVEFAKLIDEVRSRGGYDELIAFQESIESTDILDGPDTPRDGRGVLNLDDENTIQSFANLIMQSTGWPEDRRAFVLDDVRKMAQIEREQDEHCQYLQPLQNLLHTRSPSTVYASPTKYTCSCTLLGHETRIETEDIATVITAMKRVYCENCTQRSPRQEKPLA
jgi:hypothetical protein